MTINVFVGPLFGLSIWRRISLGEGNDDTSVNLRRWTPDQFDRALVQSTSTDKVGLYEPSPSQTKQRKPTKHPSSKRNPLFNSNYISVHSRSFHEDLFVGNPSFNTNSLPAWVTAFLSGPKVPMKLRSCNHLVRKTKRKQRVVTVHQFPTYNNCTLIILFGIKSVMQVANVVTHINYEVDFSVEQLKHF